MLHRRLVAWVCLLLLLPVPTFAQSSSANYKIDETFFGVGGSNNLNSTSYQGRASVGELGNGNTGSTSYQAYAGFNTTDEPYIEFVVTAANIDLGYLDTAQASTANGTFYVRAWQASGYVVRTESDPPSNGSHTLTPLASQTASSAGTEQFGMNLVANTSPTSFGSNPQQVGSSFGAAASAYGTANQYKYAKGDIVAQSAKSSGITIYTLSYVFNISSATPTGSYAFNHVLVATGTY